MGKDILAAARPPMWRIERRPTDHGEEAVRFGRHRIVLSDIAGVSLEEIRDRNIQGLILGSAAFVICATILTYFVFETGAAPRFLIALLSSRGSAWPVLPRSWCLSPSACLK